MITVKDLNDIAENKIKNEVQKEIIRSGFPPHIADRCVLLLMGKSAKNGDGGASASASDEG
jgi:hypothetical protein